MSPKTGSRWSPGKSSARYATSRRRRFLLVMLSAALAITVAILVYWWTIPRRPRPVYSIESGAGNELNLAVPPNPYGMYGFDLFKDWGEDWKARHATQKVEVEKAKLTLPELKERLEAFVRFREKSTDFNTLILFVSAHGGADGKGADGKGAYLIPENGAVVGGQRIYVTELLNMLNSTELRAVKKLLVLDATQVPNYLPRGHVYNDFARALRELDAQIAEVPHLLVLSSSAEDEVSHVHTGSGTTVFTYYFVKGLAGDADREGNHNQRVDAGELYLYIKKHVQEWVSGTLGATQTPMLLPSAEAAKLTASRSRWQKLLDSFSGRTPINMELAAVQPSGSRVAEQAGTADENGKVLGNQLIETDLNQVWEVRDKLGGSERDPAVMAPELWTRYLDTFLRYEHLARARRAWPARQGEVESVEEALRAIKNDLEKLKGDIEKAQAVPFRFLTGSLAFGEVFGSSAPAETKELEEQAQTAFDKNKLNETQVAGGPDDPCRDRPAGSEPFAKAAEDFQKIGGSNAPRLAWLRTWLYKKALEDKAHLPEVAAILPGLDPLDKPKVRPAEVQFLMGLAADKHSTLPWDRIQQALKVRQAAERAALGLPIAQGQSAGHFPMGSLAGWPWIQATITAADDERLQGEDLLLASDEASWSKAKDHFDKALAAYETATKDARTIVRGWRVCNKGFVELPYYCQWFALRPGGGHGDVKERDPGELEGLWKRLHLLNAQLHRLPEPSDRESGLQQISDATPLIEAGLEKIKQEFQAAVDANQDSTLPDSPAELDAALAVPFIPKEQRSKLLSRVLSHSASLNEQADPQVAGRSRSPVESAQCQGRLALAMLGEEYFDSFNATPYQKAFEVLRDLKDLKKPKDVADLRAIADEIHSRYEQLPNRILDQVKPADVPLPRRILAADRLARLLDGAAVERLTQSAQLPGERYQAWFEHELLCGLAERSCRDYYGSGGDGETAYYGLAGQAYLADARDCLTKLPELKAEDKLLSFDRELEKNLLEPGDFHVEVKVGGQFKPGPQSLEMTPGGVRSRWYQLSVPGNAPKKGRAFAWERSGRDLQSKWGPARKELKIGEKVVSLPEYHLTAAAKGNADDLESCDAVDVRFRGWRRKCNVTVHIRERADLTYYETERPPTASLKVQAAEELVKKMEKKQAAIAIVLDCSGSMKWGLKGRDTEGPSRIELAKDALGKVLNKKLDGVTVSVRVFKDYSGKKGKLLPERPVWAPKAWDDEKHHDQLRHILDDQYPKGGTPLIEAICKAKNEDLPRDFRGFKTVIAITDGADSKLEDPKTRQGALDQLDEAFRNPEEGILNVIWFSDEKVNETEQKAAKLFTKRVRALGGEYFEKKDLNGLTEALREFINRTLTYRLLKDNQPVEQLPRKGEPFESTAQGPRWIKGLESGRYVILTEVNRKTIAEEEIKLENGDNLALTLDDTGLPKPVFQRAIYPDSFWPSVSAMVIEKRKGDWTLRVHEKRILGGDFKGFVTLEKHSERTAKRGGFLTQSRPLWSWFQVRQNGQPQSFYPLYRYAAPAWGLDVSGWKVGQNATLDAWWSDTLPPVARRFNANTHFTTSPELKVLKEDADAVNGDLVRLESIRIEEKKVARKITATDDQPRRETATCLIVEVSFPPGRPYFALMPDGCQGGEHRFYIKGNKYVGVFWDMTGSKAQQLLKQIELCSLQSALDSAVKNNGHVSLELDNVGTEDSRPEEVK